MPTTNYTSTDPQIEQPANGHAIANTRRQSPYELRSEEVEDIMTKMPPWIIRQGTTVLALVILLIFAGAYFIHFPDVVTTRVFIKPLHTKATVEPWKEPIEYEATGNLSSELVAKVKDGQQVLIKLPLYPFEQFGILDARVEAIKADHAGTDYVVHFQLNKGLVTNTNKKIDATAPLSGTAEILTSDKTILQRLAETILRQK